jgi:cytochrome c biogenesis protein CcdA/thiol-disulfide isomerase/thioredoxin
MWALVGIGLLAGVITAISPCVLPVLPILLAGGAAGRRPLRIIAGLVASFVVFTLFATWLLDKLGLPDDLLRNVAIALLFVVAATLLLPQVGLRLERPLARLTRYRAGGGGFLLGASLGLVFVPCAGPVLAAVVTNAARDRFGIWTVLTLIAYALGAAIPMLAIAIGGTEIARRLRSGATRLRTGAGVVIAAIAVGLVFHVDDHLTNVVPGYLKFFQDRVENSKTAQRELGKLRGDKPVVATTKAPPGQLQNYGAAPGFYADGDWFNSKPLTVRSLRGKVVLVDFWTYSCINCLRTLPHLAAWYAAYHKDGLEIVGVHTPEFAFEHVSSNVAAAIKRHGVRYPVVQDNRFRTWSAYANQYWPAEYLVDRRGFVRHIHFGEGSYGETERAIRTLLGAGGSMTRVADTTPTDETTPESYLGYKRLARYAGSTIRQDRVAPYRLPARLALNDLAYGGDWRVEAERIVAGKSAQLKLHFAAENVYLVLGGRGRVRVTIGGKPAAAVNVDSYRLYTLRSSAKWANALLDLRFTPGVQAYAFTFG